MKRILTVLFCLNAAMAFAQAPAALPVIKSTGASINDFVPKGWVAVDSSFGDLNNDKVNDVAFVIQRNGKVMSRILVIAFKDNATKQYTLASQSNTFIPARASQKGSDEYKSTRINNGDLKISFADEQVSGRNGITNSSYKFNYRNKEFVLVGAHDSTYNKSTADAQDYSFDFQAKRVMITTIKSLPGNKTQDKVEPKNLDIDKMKTLSNFTHPHSWEVIKGFSI